jgi:hypothetical protein
MGRGNGMRWWNRKPGERVRWVLDPLVGVGPLRFGMSPGQVKAALGGALADVSQGLQGNPSWQQYSDVGITAIYERGPRLVAVAVDAMDGPLIWLQDIELIAHFPSEVRARLHDLAGREGAAIRVNWSGDPEVAAWGLSMGATLERGRSLAGYVARRDTMLTNALLVCAELANDPFRSEPVVRWHDIRDREQNPGAWPVKPDQDRPRWDWLPLERVGPLQFGMDPQQVIAALEGEIPAARNGHFPWPVYEKDGVWCLTEDRFDQAGVTAHYWSYQGGPTLAAVTVHGRTGPQVSYAGIQLIGRTVSAIDETLCRRAENDDTGLLFGCRGDLGPDGLNMWVRAARAGDAAVSEARFCAEDWEDRG